METQHETTPVPLEIEQLSTPNFFKEIAQGIGLTLGMGILWALEIVRNRYFHVLDRLNVKPRRKRASAFPPGRPRKHRPVGA